MLTPFDLQFPLQLKRFTIMCGEQDSITQKNIIQTSLHPDFSCIFGGKRSQPIMLASINKKKSIVSPSKLQQACKGELPFNLACLYKQASKPKA
jgi:hypothetical protein